MVTQLQKRAFWVAAAIAAAAEGMALAADAASLGALVQGAGLVMTAGPAASGTPATPDALNAAALGQRVFASTEGAVCVIVGAGSADRSSNFSANKYKGGGE